MNINDIHGGDIDSAAREFGIARSQWLDLSTGIAPWSWPIPALPQAVWQRLPAVQCPLSQPAADYYGCAVSAVLAVPGSQFAIQTLPALFKESRVAVPSFGYCEHRKAWEASQHQLLTYCDASIDALDAQICAGEIDILVVINPHNPAATRLSRQRLLHWLGVLESRGGTLIVDEAFMDAEAEASLAPLCPRRGLIVLRSLGKFFGLAGIRLGFVLADTSVQEQLRAQLGPWAVSGPAQFVGAGALLDRPWQQSQHQRIDLIKAAQVALLREFFIGEEACRVNQGPLFISVFLPNKTAESLALRLARQGILVRRFALADEGCLRFGLVPKVGDLVRLQDAIVNGATKF